MPAEKITDNIGGDADNGPNRKINIARHHHHGLADGDRQDHRNRGGDAVEHARGEIAVDLRGEEQHRSQQHQSQRGEAERLRVKIPHDAIAICSADDCPVATAMMFSCVES